MTWWKKQTGIWTQVHQIPSQVQYQLHKWSGTGFQNNQTDTFLFLKNYVYSGVQQYNLYIVTLPLWCNYSLLDNFVKDIVTFQVSEWNISGKGTLYILTNIFFTFKLLREIKWFGECKTVKIDCFTYYTCKFKKTNMNSKFRNNLFLHSFKKNPNFISFYIELKKWVISAVYHWMFKATLLFFLCWWYQ